MACVRATASSAPDWDDFAAVVLARVDPAALAARRGTAGTSSAARLLVIAGAEEAAAWERDPLGAILLDFQDPTRRPRSGAKSAPGAVGRTRILLVLAIDRSGACWARRCFRRRKRRSRARGRSGRRPGGSAGVRRRGALGGADFATAAATSVGPGVAAEREAGRTCTRRSWRWRTGWSGSRPVRRRPDDRRPDATTISVRRWSGSPRRRHGRPSVSAEFDGRFWPTSRAGAGRFCFTERAGEIRASSPPKPAARRRRYPPRPPSPTPDRSTASRNSSRRPRGPTLPSKASWPDAGGACGRNTRPGARLLLRAAAAPPRRLPALPRPHRRVRGPARRNAGRKVDLVGPLSAIRRPVSPRPHAPGGGRARHRGRRHRRFRRVRVRAPAAEVARSTALLSSSNPGRRGLRRFSRRVGFPPCAAWAATPAGHSAAVAWAFPKSWRRPAVPLPFPDATGRALEERPAATRDVRDEWQLLPLAAACCSLLVEVWLRRTGI